MNNQNEFFFYPEAKEGQNRQVIAGVFNPETKVLTIAKSECSDKDNFCKDKGRKIALGRAKCTRPIQPRYYSGKSKRNNSHLLPITVELESNEKIQNQFLSIAKTL